VNPVAPDISWQPLHLKVRSGFTGAPEAQALEQINRAIESNYLQMQGTLC